MSSYKEHRRGKALPPAIEKNDKLAYVLIFIVSIIVFAAVVFLKNVELKVNLGFDKHIFARLNALINTFGLTKRESEVLYWAIKGKTNRDIGDILGTSPRTVNKHLEHVFTKLGVETRTAAASYVASKLRTLK